MWPTTIQVILVIVLGIPIYFYYEVKYQKKNFKAQFKHAAWLLGYLIFISIMSYCGSDGFGGQNWITYPWDFLVIAAVSLIFYKLAIDTSLEKIDPAAIKVNEKIRLKESEE